MGSDCLSDWQFADIKALRDANSETLTTVRFDGFVNRARHDCGEARFKPIAPSGNEPVNGSVLAGRCKEGVNGQVGWFHGREKGKERESEMVVNREKEREGKREDRESMQIHHPPSLPPSTNHAPAPTLL